MPLPGRPAGGAMRWLARAALAALIAFAVPAHATFHTFRIGLAFDL